MTTKIAGKLDATGRRFALAVARFNSFITEKLVAGALDTLERHGADPDKLTTLWVPGSFELPLAAQKLAHSGDFDAIVALGCLIRGHTPHFDHIAAACADGLTRAALESGVPITFGVITANTLEQAIERAGSKAGNKGADAALAAIEMANVLAALAK